MSFENIVQSAQLIRFVDVVQILAIIFVVFYLIFALLVLRQTQLMIKTLFSPISRAVIILAIVHIGIVLSILILLVGVI